MYDCAKTVSSLGRHADLERYLDEPVKLRA